MNVKKNQFQLMEDLFNMSGDESTPIDHNMEPTKLEKLKSYDNNVSGSEINNNLAIDNNLYEIFE